jgi:uncharacterized protein (TIGR03437 family)
LSAHAGEVTTFYGIGFGPVAALPATGKPAGSSLSTMNSAPSVTINAQNATMLFAGLSPRVRRTLSVQLVMPDQKVIGNLTVQFNTGGLNPNLVTIPVQPWGSCGLAIRPNHKRRLPQRGECILSGLSANRK